MFHRLLSRLVVSISLALIALVIIAALVTPPSFAQLGSSVTFIGSGGTLASADHQLTVTVSSNAIKQPVTITLSANVTRTIPARFATIGSAFVIATQSPAVPPMQIVVHYTTPATISEQDLLIMHYDPMADKWLPLPTTLDWVNHVAAATAEQVGVYALVMSPAIASLPSSAIIVDDFDTGFVRYGSTAGWHGISGTTAHYYLGHMYWTSNTYSILDNYAIWTPALSAGSYQVYAFIDWDNATTQNARYQIVHNGQTTVFSISQNSYYAQWVSLGRYDFSSTAGSNYVRLDDVTSESNLSKQIGFDAIAFVPSRVYLPLIMNRYPIPIKQNTGLHLGSRDYDWTDAMLQPVDGDKGGIWPTSITAISHQIYNLERPTTSTPDNPWCRISNVEIFKPTVFNYMTRAAQSGVKVIIRIHPSPGNFIDYTDTLQTNHYLLSSGGPTGGGYCNNNGHAKDVRHVNDLVQEIAQIHEYNVRHGLHEYAFIPANEPNLEWYTTAPISATYPKLTNPIAWQEMDTYLSTLYQHVQLISVPPDLTGQWGAIRLLTPAMAQERLAEGIDPVTCAQTRLDYTLEDGTSGYENMATTYQTSNDGLAWNNYWRFDNEGFNGCADYGDHLSSMVSPFWLSDAMRNPSTNKPNFIIEADLASWKQMKNDNSLRDKSAAPADTAWSIRHFFAYEPGAVANAWLLSYEGSDPEIYWHEAYTNTTGLLTWFSNWWGGSELP